MASTRKDLPRPTMAGGMTQAMPSWQVPDQAWWYASGMRFAEGRITQVPRKVERTSLALAHLFPVTNMEFLPSGKGRSGTLVAWTQDSVWQVLPGSGRRLLEAGETEPSFAYSSVQPLRWGTCRYNNRVFFVNELNPVHVTDGASIEEVVGSPKARYVDVFFNHLVVGRVNGGDCRFAWSHLDNFGEWRARSHTEADFFDCTDHQRESAWGRGITGLRKLGNLQVVYTTTGLYVAQYVGLPTVMRTDPVPDPHGNSLPWALVGTDRQHFFVDADHGSFYRFDGQKIEEVGQPVKRQFFRELGVETAELTWGYVDQAYEEVHWVYRSQRSPEAFDREVVLSLREGTWRFGDVEDVYSFASGGTRERTIDEMEAQVDKVTVDTDSAGIVNETVGRIYGSHHGRILREENEADSNGMLLFVESPVLETGDFAYGSLKEVKQVDGLTLHTDYRADSCSGVQVEHIQRDRLEQTPRSNVLPAVFTYERPSVDTITVGSILHKFVFRPISSNQLTRASVAAPFLATVRAEVLRATGIQGAFDMTVEIPGQVAGWYEPPVDPPRDPQYPPVNPPVIIVDPPKIPKEYVYRRPLVIPLIDARDWFGNATPFPILYQGKSLIPYGFSTEVMPTLTPRQFISVATLSGYSVTQPQVDVFWAWVREVFDKNAVSAAGLTPGRLFDAFKVPVDDMPGDELDPVAVFKSVDLIGWVLNGFTIHQAIATNNELGIVDPSTFEKQQGIRCFTSWCAQPIVHLIYTRPGDYV